MATASGAASPRNRGARDLTAAPVSDELRRAVEDLGLSPYESRVLLALLRLGSANSIQLAKLSGVPRTAVYPVLETLGSKGLVERAPTEGPAIWGSPGREEILRRLDVALEVEHEERLRRHRERAEQVRQMLAASIPEDPESSLPYVHILRGAGQVRAAYDDLLGTAKREVLMFTRPPFAYVNSLDNVNPSVLEMLNRNIPTQVLYQADQVARPEFEGFREEMEVYHEAGVEARVVEALPLKLVVVDRLNALVGMTHPRELENGYPTTMLVEHPGYAELQAEVFEQRWRTGVPYENARRAARRDRPRKVAVPRADRPQRPSAADV